MKTAYYNEYSHNLNRNMEFKVYGHGGRPCLVFPSQDGRFFDFENNKMVESVQEFIDAGRIQLFCIDSNDTNSWSSTHWDNRKRIEAHEAYYNYVCNELTPRIFEINAQSNGDYYYGGLLTTGCSMGATHALNFFLRRPDIFDGVIALSGVYDAKYFFHDYFDDLVYINSPVSYLEGMSNDYYYVDLYRQRQIIVCVGQGAWEEPMIQDTARIKELLEYKQVPAWIDFWGQDVAHDWPWWRKQLPYYLQYVC